MGGAQMTRKLLGRWILGLAGVGLMVFSAADGDVALSALGALHIVLAVYWESW